MANKTYNKTIGIEVQENGSVTLKWESWKSESIDATERKDITVNEKLFIDQESMFDFVMNKYKVRPTDQEIVESCLKAIERQAKKAWYPLQRITKSMGADSPFSVKIYGVIKNAFISHLARVSGFDFTQLLSINPSKLEQFDPSGEEVSDLAKV